MTELMYILVTESRWNIDKTKVYIQGIRDEPVHDL